MDDKLQTQRMKVWWCITHSLSNTSLLQSICMTQFILTTKASKSFISGKSQTIRNWECHIKKFWCSHRTPLSRTGTLITVKPNFKVATTTSTQHHAQSTPYNPTRGEAINHPTILIPACTLPPTCLLFLPPPFWHLSEAKAITILKHSLHVHDDDVKLDGARLGRINYALGSLQDVERHAFTQRMRRKLIS